ncbi:MAG: hypothetical protein JJU11_03260 [Candidatus Sumerlaeia bacterium]|nr:hypothetical protein [Candidatus Sumerlaeia bacterium]
MKWSMLMTNLLVLILGGILLAGCNDRNMVVGSSTTFGVQLSATDIRTRPPKVAIAYDRQELALIPTSGQVAGKNNGDNTDTFSSLMALSLDTQLGGKTTLQQFIGTGHAAVVVAGSREMSEVFGDVAFNADDWWLILEIAEIVYNDDKARNLTDREKVLAERIKESLDRFAEERIKVAHEMNLHVLDGGSEDCASTSTLRSDNLDFIRFVRGLLRVQETVTNLIVDDEHARNYNRCPFLNFTHNGEALDINKRIRRKWEYIDETSRLLVRVPEYGKMIDLVHGKLKGKATR